MRGKVQIIGLIASTNRITPAYAGKRSFAFNHLLRSWDHPCVYGEKVIVFSTTALARGSPLRMRGKVAKALTMLGGNRITPAYAGKSNAKKERTVYFGNHPCVCGEKVEQEHKVVELLGSPLRMRGKVHTSHQ